MAMITYSGDPWSYLIGTTLDRWKAKLSHDPGSVTKLEVNVRDTERQEVTRTMIEILTAYKLNRYPGEAVEPFRGTPNWMDDFVMEWKRIRSESDNSEERWGTLTNVVNKMTRDEAIEAQREEKRRKQILTGELDPTAEDVEWLTEFARKHEEEAATMRAVADAAKKAADLAAQASLKIPYKVKDGVTELDSVAS